ncbi:MAG TPA: hypothetical protein VNC78_00015 [Actinomycetota bacterium]|nr:hypothetical protein [Actinomycetota bacterium]
MTIRRRLHVAAALAAILALAPLAPAESAYPGGNGLIAFDRYTGDQPDIFVMNPDGTFATNITHTPNVLELNPAFSADGSKIVFEAIVPPGSSDIFTMAPDGSAVTRVTQTDREEQFPQLSPDGTLVAFVRYDNRFRGDVWVSGLDGSSARSLTSTHDIAFGRLSWAPDGSSIVFARLAGGLKHDLYEVDLATTSVTRLTSDPDSEDWPDYSPDGTQVAYAHSKQTIEAASDFRLEIINADGTNLRSYPAATGEYIFGLSWAPDGTKILTWGIDDDGTLMRLWDPATGTSTVLSRESPAGIAWQPCQSQSCSISTIADSATYAYVHVTRRATRAMAEVVPVHRGAPVELTMFRRVDGSFQEVASKTATVGRYNLARARFPRFKTGRCRLTAAFAGDSDHRGSSGKITFPCRSFSAG